MIIVTERMTNVIIGMGEYAGIWDNGYPVILDGYGNQNAYVASDVELHELSYVPDYVVILKYCYTPESGFYENPNYVEPDPYGIPKELVERIKNDAIAEVEEAVVNADE